MKKIYEVGRLLAEPVLPPLYKQIRYRLKQLVSQRPATPQILDVGGRKSPYTIGVKAAVTVIDLPRESDIQRQLNLGVSDRMITEIIAKRSNVSTVIVGDMTRLGLPSDNFDIVVSVEVLEHVETDELFVSEVARVLKPDGIFLMSTPNGDWVANKNPDHKRHYKRSELLQLLEKHFDRVEIDYAIAGGRFRKMGLKSWSVSHPSTIGMSVIGNLINSIESNPDRLRDKAYGTHHLIAVARKSV